MSDDLPKILVEEDGPYIVLGLGNLRVAGNASAADSTTVLCRCGASKNKPHCDGTHSTVGFTGARPAGAEAGEVREYSGGHVIVRDNRSLCAHAGVCTEKLPGVFRAKERPWIDPAAAARDELVAVIRQCPSGALSVAGDEGAPSSDTSQASCIAVEPSGPYVCSGGIELADIALPSGVTNERYTLCRCGGSKNKPFCDGTHWSIEFDISTAPAPDGY